MLFLFFAYCYNHDHGHPHHFYARMHYAYIYLLCLHKKKHNTHSSTSVSGMHVRSTVVAAAAALPLHHAHSTYLEPIVGPAVAPDNGLCSSWGIRGASPDFFPTAITSTRYPVVLSMIINSWTYGSCAGYLLDVHF